MIPLRFEYIDEISRQKVYVSILRQFEHHYTGETMYYIREEGESGWVDYLTLKQRHIQLLLDKRVEEIE